MSTTSAALARYAGAGAIVGGMTLAPEKTAVMAPLFLGGWAALTYGLTGGLQDMDPWILGGVAGVVVGGMGARMTDDPTAGTVAKVTFGLGWLAIAEGIAQSTGTSRLVTYGSSVAVGVGAALIRARVFDKADIPGWLGPLVFAAGWGGVLYSASRRQQPALGPALV